MKILSKKSIIASKFMIFMEWLEWLDWQIKCAVTISTFQVGDFSLLTFHRGDTHWEKRRKREKINFFLFDLYSMTTWQPFRRNTVFLGEKRGKITRYKQQQMLAEIQVCSGSTNFPATSSYLDTTVIWNSLNSKYLGPTNWNFIGN